VRPFWCAQGAWLTPQTSLRGRRAREVAKTTHAQLRPARALRAQMGFLVDALQFYLHADVLEPCWSALDARIQVRCERLVDCERGCANGEALWVSIAGSASVGCGFSLPGVPRGC
jgi:hypothetical protein